MHATKEKIYIASQELITQYGYSNFSIGLVTKTLHISKGIVNYHYPQKEILLNDIVDEYQTKLNQDLLSIQFIDNNNDILYLYLQTYFDFYEKNKYLVMAYYEVVLNHRHQDGKLIYTLEDTSCVLQEILKKGQDENKYRQFHKNMMERFILNCLMSCFYHHAYSRTALDELYTMIKQSLIKERKSPYESNNSRII